MDTTSAWRANAIHTAMRMIRSPITGPLVKRFD
jgi:hypothetical protein